jgi:predicted DNA-binding protein with PD1-like motif
MGDAIVYTTAEIVVGNMEDVIFSRKKCPKSGWPELSVTKI